MSLLFLHNVKHVVKILSSLFITSTVDSSSTVKVVDVKIVPFVVMHLTLACLIVKKSKALLADSATFITCCGFNVALGVGLLPPFAKPSSSPKTVKRKNKNDF